MSFQLLSMPYMVRLDINKMKIVCNVKVENRLLPVMGINANRKFIKSTLALCKKPKTSEFCMILFNTNNQNGTKYDIKGNINAVLTKFLSEGKATIQFVQPSHDLFVQGDKIQLKGFLHLLGRVVTNKIGENEITYSSVSVTAISSKNIAPTKLQIRDRGNYPLRGFPRTLEVLTISEINRSSLDRGILQLKKLRTLDLSYNLIELLPEEFSAMTCLVELNLSNNNFGKSHPNTWSWMSGNIAKTLKLLNLCENQMKFLPDQIVKLHNLITLNVDRNELRILPSGIGSLHRLRILTASKNMLKSLPGSAKKLNLLTLDLSDNHFVANAQNANIVKPNCPIKVMPICSLMEIAAREVIAGQLSYTTKDLPTTVIKYLDLAKYCICGKACFSISIEHKHRLSLSTIAHSYVLSAAGTGYIPIDCNFCSLNCFNSVFSARLRRPTI